MHDPQRLIKAQERPTDPNANDAAKKDHQVRDVQHGLVLCHCFEGIAIVNQVSQTATPNASSVST